MEYARKKYNSVFIMIKLYFSETIKCCHEIVREKVHKYW